jgi:hypothetical protein
MARVAQLALRMALRTTRRARQWLGEGEMAVDAMNAK